jgi:hypothetical protein
MDGFICKARDMGVLDIIFFKRAVDSINEECESEREVYVSGMYTQTNKSSVQYNLVFKFNRNFITKASTTVSPTCV